MDVSGITGGPERPPVPPNSGIVGEDVRESQADTVPCEQLPDLTDGDFLVLRRKAALRERNGASHPLAGPYAPDTQWLAPVRSHVF